MIELINVTKTYPGGAVVLQDISLTVETGEILILIGPSGCGKTTTMRMINRLIEPTSGTIRINGEDIERFNPVELRRNIGYVIQSVGLFPHMTIGENISVVPSLKGSNQADCQEKALNLLELVGLPADYLNRYPRELSGGQQQRVGVARALAADPDIILMDEPFGALDPITRGNLQDELLRLQKEVRKTIVFVTHDMDEAIKLGDRIAILKDGQILQVDTPEQLMTNPAHGFVETFLGSRRLVQQPEWMSVKEIMITDPVVCQPDLSLQKALQHMRHSLVDSLLVIGPGRKLCGIVTALEIHNKINDAKRVEEIMTPPKVTAGVDENLKTALQLMADHNLSNLPVTDDAGNLVGLITRGSLVKVLAQKMVV